MRKSLDRILELGKETGWAVALKQPLSIRHRPAQTADRMRSSLTNPTPKTNPTPSWATLCIPARSSLACHCAQRKSQDCVYASSPSDLDAHSLPEADVSPEAQPHRGPGPGDTLEGSTSLICSPAGLCCYGARDVHQVLGGQWHADLSCTTGMAVSGSLLHFLPFSCLCKTLCFVVVGTWDFRGFPFCSQP